MPKHKSIKVLFWAYLPFEIKKVFWWIVEGEGIFWTPSLNRLYNVYLSFKTHCTGCPKKMFI